MSASIETASPARQQPGTKFLVCFAVKEEAKAFLERGGGECARVLVTGMGQSNTRRAIEGALRRWHGRLGEPALPGVHGRLGELPLPGVLTCGFTGGLKPEFERGMVLFETADRALESRLRNSGAIPARFTCVSRIAVTAAEKGALREATGADAVEMESAFVHEACRRHGIPCATVRVVLDESDEDLPLDFNALLTPSARLSLPRLIWALIKAPKRVSSLMRFQRQTVAAGVSLGGVLLKACRIAELGK